MKAADFFFNHRTTGLLLEGKTAHAVQVRKSAGAPLVEKAVTAEFEDPKALRRLLEKEGFDLRHIVMCLPRSLAGVSYLSIPSVNPAEIAEMVALEAVRKMPFKPEEILIDYDLIRVEPNGYSSVMMIVVLNPEIEKPLALLHEAGLYPKKVVLSSQALARLATLDKREGTLLFLEPGPNWAGFNFLEKGRLTFTRSASLGARDGEARASKILEEIELSMQAYRKQGPLAEPFAVAMVPPPPGWEPLQEKLESQYACTRFDPFPKLARAKGLSWPPGPGPYAALGTALCADKRVNLMPRREKQLLAGSARRHDWVRLGVLASILALIWGGIAYVKQDRAQARLARLQREWTAISPRAGELKRMAAQVKIVEGETAGQVSALDVLASLHRIVPAHITLGGLNFESDGRVSIRGSAPSLSDAVGLVGLLERSPTFVGVELKSSNVLKRDGRDVVEFQIQGRARRQD
ncbi:MAG: PilN domain-containing protein [Elusimicrobiota bacterium]